MRSALDIPVTLSFDGESAIQARIANLSMMGMYVPWRGAISVGQTCEASFEAGPQEPVHVRGTVVRRDDNGIGIEITALETASWETLRELIVDNAEEPGTCDTEILSNMDQLPPWY